MVLEVNDWIICSVIQLAVASMIVCTLAAGFAVLKKDVTCEIITLIVLRKECVGSMLNNCGILYVSCWLIFLITCESVFPVRWIPSVLFQQT